MTGYLGQTMVLYGSLFYMILVSPFLYAAGEQKIECNWLEKTFFYGNFSCVCVGSQGVFCEVQPTDRQRLEFLTKLGFLEILRGEARSREGVVLGRLL